MSTDAQERRLEELQERLSDRDSVTHFARSGVALIAALILAAASGKLFWDANRWPVFPWLVAAAALGLAVHAIQRYLSGRRALKLELAQFEDLKALRRTLRLDDPSALLPQ